MNNKGFTLVELLATLIILAIISGIGAYSISEIITSSKVNDCESLKANILNAAEAYYQECKYSYTTSIEEICPDGEIQSTITLNNLVKYGYLTSNSENKDGKIINPIDKTDISEFEVTIDKGNFSINLVCDK